MKLMKEYYFAKNKELRRSLSVAPMAFPSPILAISVDNLAFLTTTISSAAMADDQACSHGGCGRPEPEPAQALKMQADKSKNKLLLYFSS